MYISSVQMKKKKNRHKTNVFRVLPVMIECFSSIYNGKYHIWSVDDAKYHQNFLMVLCAI